MTRLSLVNDMRSQAQTTAGDPAVSMRGITKRFGSLVANSEVDLEFNFGEVHALIGENGAGKSTLMNTLFGMTLPDEGEISLRGKLVEVTSPREAMQLGLGMVHQSFQIFPDLTVLENVIFGDEISQGGFLRMSVAAKRVKKLMDSYGLDVDLNRRAGSLPLGLQQQVEILKVLYREADVLIMDEPTAVLAPQERDGLFRTLAEFRSQGKAVVLVTHKLNEVMAIADRYTVLRDGKVVAAGKTVDTDPDGLAEAMTGREVNLNRRFRGDQPGGVALKVDNLTVHERGIAVVDDVSFEVSAGEVLGVAGVAGNGQNELARALLGLIHADEGTVEVLGEPIEHLSTLARRKRRVGYVPEDRHRTGTAPAAPIRDNLLFARRDERQWYSPLRTLRAGRMDVAARERMAAFDVRADSPANPVGSLSGGNMQKVVLAREITDDAQVYVIEQPTRGVDIGAIEYVYHLLDEQRRAGKAILLISSELSELFALCDRLIVMYEGRIVGELVTDRTTEREVGLLMAGVAA